MFYSILIYVSEDRVEAMTAEEDAAQAVLPGKRVERADGFKLGG